MTQSDPETPQGDAAPQKNSAEKQSSVLRRTAEETGTLLAITVFGLSGFLMLFLCLALSHLDVVNKNTACMRDISGIDMALRKQLDFVVFNSTAIDYNKYILSEDSKYVETMKAAKAASRKIMEEDMAGSGNATLLIKTILTYGDGNLRAAILKMPMTWRIAAIDRTDVLIMFAIVMTWTVAVISSLYLATRYDHDGLLREAAEGGRSGKAQATAANPAPAENGGDQAAEESRDGAAKPGEPVRKTLTGLLKYFYQDFGILEYDQVMHHKGVRWSHYGGVIHWTRDTIEKMLSISMIFIFIFFVARLIRYVLFWITGEGWRLLFLPLDVNFAITAVGVALIIDSIILVSTMTDAPGIARALDAVIVALAGYVIMLVEATPGKESLLSFRIIHDDGFARYLPFMIAALFIVRWFVRNPTLQAMYSGRLPNQYVDYPNQTGNIPQQATAAQAQAPAAARAQQADTPDPGAGGGA